MAQLNNLIVTGSSRFLNKVCFSNGGTFNGNLNVNNGSLQLYDRVALEGYDSWLRINEPKHFTSGIYCGDGTLRIDGEFQVGEGGNYFKANSSAITCNKSLIANAGVDFRYGASIRNAGLELYFTTPFIDFHFDNSNNDYTSRIIEGNKGVLNINGVTCSSSNLAANNVSATNVNVSSRINADAATAIFNNVYVKDELRSTTWAIDNITNLGSTFYVSPCIIFTNPSVYINSKSGTTVTLTITDNNIISSTIGGQTWTSGSKIKLMGRINTSVLGVVNGTMARQLNTTTAKTAYITLNFATTDDCAGIEQGKTYSGSSVGDLKMMMYEVNLNVNGTTKSRPVGIRMSSYNEDKKSSIDIYDGTVDDGKPIVRMGYLGGLPAVNGENPTGYGFYAVGNAFFSGRIVSGSGKIGNWNIGTDSLYVPNKTGISSNIGKYAFWAGESNNKNGASDTNAVFRVGHDGVLIATNATITGSVTATSGIIGGCSISDGTLIVPSANIYGTLNANQISAGAITSDKIKSGEVTSDKIAANAITAAKISAGAITSDKITTNNIAGTNGWINLRSGTFKYNDGALAWDGSTMTIGGFKISKYKIINDAIGICSTTGQEWAFWAGASSGANAPFHVGHNGELYASNATIGGIIRAKQSISVYNDTFATYQDVVKWDGSNLSIGLVGNAGSTGVKGAQIAFLGSQISVGNSSIVCGSISGTNSSFTNVWVENFTNASTFKENITCNKNLKVKGDFTFADYQQDTLATASEVVYRRPIASAASNNSRVAFLQGASGNKISIRAQYGKSDFSSATFTASSSDIRLKEDVKDSSVNALSKIMQMQIREFNWKQTGVHQELGCVADELELIDPLLTVGGGYDDDGTMNIKSIDTLLLSEYAIKGIQELYRQNKQQQKRIKYLESQLRNK